ncbi:MAG: sigma-70 family RNA polymerase sigma factor [Planctomycetes bacterium]|nr:sigma-70 family RNA polymerase sigma factor [Planctomycetota bacterium]
MDVRNDDAGDGADDRTLVRSWCDGRDEGAFSLLVKRHRAMVEGVCRRELLGSADAEDVAQEVFADLADQAGTIRGEPGAWLRTVALHRCLNLVRSRQRRRQHEQRAGRETIAATAVPATEVDEELLEACLAELGEDDRALLVRLFVEGQSQTEVARATELSPLAVHRRLHRALDRLREGFRRRGHRVGAAVLALVLAGGDRGLAAQVLGRSAVAPWAALAAGGLLAIAVGGWWLHGRMTTPPAAATAPATVPPSPVVALPPTDRSAPGGRPAAGGSAAVVAPAPAPAFARSDLAALLAQRPAGAPSAGEVLQGFQEPVRREGNARAKASARPFAELSWATSVDLAVPGLPPFSAWLLVPDQGMAVGIVATVDPSAHGGELVTLMTPREAGDVPVAWDGRGTLMRQAIVHWPARGKLVVIEEVDLSGGEVVARRRLHEWHDRDHQGRRYTAGTMAANRAGASFALNRPVLVLDAWWRDLAADEASRLVAAHPATSGTVVDH